MIKKLSALMSFRRKPESRAIAGMTVFGLALLMCLFLTTTEAQALGDLTITPIRIVFQTRDRSASIELLNTSNTTKTYRLSWSLMKAMAEGKYEIVPATKASDNDPHSVAKMVIFSPRQVTIEPHGEQVIRLSLRRPADLPPGEYRAHLTMTRLAKHETEKPDPKAKDISMALNVNLGFSVPIIVRQGEDKALKISILNPRFTPGKEGGTILNLDLNRDAGIFSSYGTIHVFWTPPKGSEQEIGTLSNMALYPELKTRHVTVPLLKAADLRSGTIRITYVGALESEGTTWAEKSFTIKK